MFADREEAGERLGRKLAQLNIKAPVVLALPRGGVVIGSSIAKILRAPLELLIVRKIGCPGQPEFAVGALAEGGVEILSQGGMEDMGVCKADLKEIIAAERKELQRRRKVYRQGRKLPNLKGKTAVVVDDGVATGLTARAAIVAARKLGAEKIVFAAPVGAAEAVAELKKEVPVVCLETPYDLGAVGEFYINFPPVSDEEVKGLLC